MDSANSPKQHRNDCVHVVAKKPFLPGNGFFDLAIAHPGNTQI
jgi:hypothetical protein